VPSLGELLDVKMIDAIAPDDLLRRLDAVSLEGVRFLDAAALGDGDRALGRVLGSSEIAAELPEGVERDLGLSIFASAAPLSILRAAAGEGKRLKLGRRLDVRRSLFTVAVPPSETRARLADELGFASDRVISFKLGVSHEGSARPTEVVEALYGADAAATARFARVALWAEAGAPAHTIDPLDFPALRTAFAAASAAASEAAALAPAPPQVPPLAPA
jgi:hypothetical protein